MSMQLSPQPIFQSFLPNGAFNAGGQVFTYIAGTTTPQASYTDSTGVTPNTNPVILNSLGQASIWLNPALIYKFVVQDQFGNPLYTTDQIQGVLSLATVSLGPVSPTTTPLTITGSLGATVPVVQVTNNSNTAGGVRVSVPAGGGFGLVITNGTVFGTLSINASGQLVLANSGGVTSLILGTPINTGWGTPSGASIVPNFPGSTATLLQTSSALAQVILALEQFGLFGT